MQEVAQWVSQPGQRPFGNAPDAAVKALGRDRTNVVTQRETDRGETAFRRKDADVQRVFAEGSRERENDHHRSPSLIEAIIGNYQHGPDAGLLVTSRRGQVGVPDFTT